MRDMDIKIVEELDRILPEPEPDTRSKKETEVKNNTRRTKK